MLATNKSESKLEFAEVNHTPTAADDVSINSDLIPGVYIYETSHNFDNYLKELGVNYILRQFGICLKNRSSRSDRLFFLIYFSDL